MPLRRDLARYAAARGEQTHLCRLPTQKSAPILGEVDSDLGGQSSALRRREQARRDHGLRRRSRAGGRRSPTGEAIESMTSSLVRGCDALDDRRDDIGPRSAGVKRNVRDDRLGPLALAAARAIRMNCASTAAYRWSVVSSSSPGSKLGASDAITAWVPPVAFGTNTAPASSALNSSRKLAVRGPRRSASRRSADEQVSVGSRSICMAQFGGDLP